MTIYSAECPKCGLLMIRNDDEHKLSHQIPLCPFFVELMAEAKKEFGDGAHAQSEVLDSATGRAPEGAHVKAKAEPSTAHDRHAYREDCPGCQMVLIGPGGRALATDDPIAVAAGKVWRDTPLEVRAACQRVWVHNSREPGDLIAMEGAMLRVQKAMAS